MELVFTERAKRDWRGLDSSVQNQLRKKLAFYLRIDRPWRFAEKLKDDRLGKYRFRIGDWRIIFDAKDDTIFVLRVGHRKDIYNK